MRRREFLSTLGATGAALAASRTARAEERPPNLVYILCDDAGYGDLGCYGQKLIKTPHLDRMATQGTTFTQCYAGSAVCGPTRCVLMTGLHSGHCTRRGNRTTAHHPGHGKDRGLLPLGPDDYTVAAHLKKAGYGTGGIGKWGLGNSGTPGTPDKHGFDHFFGYLDQVHAHDYYTTWLWRDGRRIPLPGNQGEKKTQYTHDLFEADSLDFIRRHRSDPFFLYLPYTLPHGKYVIPSDEPYSEKPWPQREKNYAAMITRLDATVGRVLDLLVDLGLARHTLVIFTSDNGPNPPFAKRFGSDGGLRGLKRRLYEGGIRVPTLAWWPGHVPADRVSDFPWWQADVFPTACALAGIDPPEGMDGRSVLPTLLGRTQAQQRFLYWEFHNPFHQAVRMGRWKAVRFGTEEPLELYDLNTDPGEARDVAANHPHVVQTIETYLLTARTPSQYWPASQHRKGRG